MINFKSLCYGLLLLSITGFVRAESQDKPVTSSMVSQSIRLNVLPDKVAEFEVLVAQLVRDVHANEPGVQVYEVRRVKDQPLTYVYFISFENQAAFDRYSSADWHTQASPKIVALLDGNPVFEDFESFY
jgi:quinol monooxygenase YgiN